MIKHIRIGSFRGIQELELIDVNRVNVLIGQNNSGKTSILEALQLINQPDVVANMISIAKNRETLIGFATRSALPYDRFLNTFNIQTGYKCIEIEVNTHGGKTYFVNVEGHEEKELFIPEFTDRHQKENFYYKELEDYIRVFRGQYRYYCPLGDFGNMFEFSEVDRKIYGDRIPLKKVISIQYISPVDAYTNRYTVRNLQSGLRVAQRRMMIEVLQVFDERIIGVDVVNERGRAVPYVELYDKGLVPLSIFGDGLKKVLALASALVRAQDGILLIDELETGIHKDALRRVGSWLLQAAEEFNVQVFLTTHSGEAIDAVLQGADNKLDDITVFRLEHFRERIYAKKYDGHKLYKIRNNQGLDIR